MSTKEKKKEVDFIGGQGPLTEEEQRTISAYILLHKRKRVKKKSTKAVAGKE